MQPDGSYIEEIRERETPIELRPHHDYIDEMWAAVRKKRDKLLADSDWVVARAYETGEPVPVEWAAYRKALRDITLEESPYELTWPEKPSSVPAEHSGVFTVGSM